MKPGKVTKSVGWLLEHDLPRAKTLLQESVTLRPQAIACWMQLAAVHERLGERAAGSKAALQALALRPDARQLLAIGNLLTRMGEPVKGLAALQEGFGQLGRPLASVPLVLYGALAAAEFALTDQLIAQIRAAHAAGDIAGVKETPRTHLLWCADQAINDEVIRLYGQSRKVRQPLPDLPPPAPLAGRRLRVGYLSSDFRDHATAWLVNGLLRHHDHTRFELFAYCCSWDDKSAMRKTVLAHFDHVRSVTTLSDGAAAALIRDDQIDVLVDLNGPTRSHRLGILSQRAAPVQISYLGFPGSAGGYGVDYIVADDYTMPRASALPLPEKIIRLSHTYQVNDYAARELPAALTRAQVGLPEGVTVLGMFNAINKVRSEVWAVWMAIMQAVPDALLWVLDPGQQGRVNLAKAAAAAGVDPRRILAAPRMHQQPHLTRMQCCDLMLDPWPYGGHTTTGDALFAGVPVLALEGTNFAGRVSGGLLRAAGLPELVLPDTQAYADKAISLLRAPQELARLKAQIRATVKNTAVFDAATRTRELESAFLQAAQRAVDGKTAQDINAQGAHAPGEHVVVLNPGARPQRMRMRLPDAGSLKGPKVSCLMVTRGQLFPAMLAIDCFRRQTYANRELVIVSCEASGPLEAMLTALGDPSIRFIKVARATLGELRTQSVAFATGALLCTWDDDDICDARRIELQVMCMGVSKAAAVLLQRLTLWWPARATLAVSHARPWEGSMLIRRSALPAYPALDKREDNQVLQHLLQQQRIALLDLPDLYCYIVHDRNTWAASHFDGFLHKATQRFDGPAYQQACERLDLRLPLARYAEGLAARI